MTNKVNFWYIFRVTPSPAAKLPVVYEFADSASYFRAVRVALGSRGRALTLSRWSKRLGYRSERVLGMVASGRRLPSRALINSISRDLHLPPEQARYLELLAASAKASPGDPIRAELDRLNMRATRKTILEEAHFAYVADWYHFPIKRLVEREDFSENPEWICQRLRRKVGPGEVRQALKNLEALGLIQREAPGRRYRVARPGEGVFTPADVPSTASRRHHLQMTARANDAITEVPRDRREFLTLTWNGDPKDIPEIKQALRDFREQFDRRFGERGGKAVFQANIQFFEHTDFEGTPCAQNQS